MIEGPRGEPMPGAAEAKKDTARWRRNLALIVFGAGAAYFLLTEHLAHTTQALPWIILLLGPLMHVLMHRGHGGRHGAHPERDSTSPGAPR